MARKGRLVANLGDVNPIQYGGFLIFSPAEGQRYFECEVIEPLDGGQGEGSDVEVYRFTLDRRQWLGDVEWGKDVLTLSHYRNDLPWPEVSKDDEAQSLRLNYGCPYSPGSYTEWWDDSIEEIWRSCGYDGSNGPSLYEFRNAQASTEAHTIGAFYQALVSYYGAHEFDQDPLRLTEKEAVARYSRMFAGSRRRKEGKVVCYA